MGHGLLEQPDWSRTMLRWVLLFFFVIAVAGAVARLLLDNNVVDEASIVPKTGVQQSRATRVEAVSSQPSQPMAPLGNGLAPLADGKATDQTSGHHAEEIGAGLTRAVGGWLVRAADRSPLSLCRLRVATALNDLTELDASAPWSTTADERGLFSLTKVPTKDASLVVLMPSGLRVFLALEDGEHDLLDQELVLDTGFIVEGEVLDMLGTPIEGARVVAATTPPVSDAATTDSGGFFRLLDVVALPHSASVPLMASAATFVDGELDVPTPHSPSVTGPVTFRLSSAGAIAGTLTLDTPPPGGTGRHDLTQASVAVWLEMTASHGRAANERLSAHPDADGHYHIDGIPPGRFVLTASAPGRTASQWLADVLVDAGRTTIVDWILAAGASVSGQVVDSAGRALPDVPIQLERFAEWDAPEATGPIRSSRDDFETRTISVPGGWRVRSSLSKQTTRTDEQGRYSFQTISPGLVRISVMAAPAGLLTPEPGEFTVADLQNLRDVDFAMHRGIVLTGRVWDDMGRALQDARAQVSTTTDAMNWNRDLGVSTDAGGYFEIGGLSPERELTLWVTHAGFSDHLQKITPGRGPVEVRLKPSVMLTCRVLASETGLPLRHYEVVITQDVITRSREISSPDGRFALELDDDIAVSITISAPGRMTTTLDGVRPSDTLLSPLEIMLPPGS